MELCLYSSCMATRTSGNVCFDRLGAYCWWLVRKTLSNLFLLPFIIIKSFSLALFLSRSFAAASGGANYVQPPGYAQLPLTTVISPDTPLHPQPQYCSIICHRLHLFTERPSSSLARSAILNIAILNVSLCRLSADLFVTRRVIVLKCRGVSHVTQPSGPPSLS